jgi:preprotein translocase subunit SecE
MFFDVFDVIIQAWNSGKRSRRSAVVVMGICTVLALLFLGLNQWIFHMADNAAAGVLVFFVVPAFLAYTFLKAVGELEEKTEIKERVQRAESAVEERPLENRPLWDLARTRLEVYFERNLSQIRTIFWITVLVMLAGFVMIFYGIYRAFDSSNIQPSLVAAASGIVTEFIAATFLVIYRSTMAQASEYVATLERINAVGMAIQIADSIAETDAKLKSKVRAELAAQILNSSPSMNQRRPASVATSSARRRVNQNADQQE